MTKKQRKRTFSHEKDYLVEYSYAGRICPKQAFRQRNNSISYQLVV